MILSPNDNIPNEKVAKMQLCKLLLSQIKTFSNEVFTSGNIFQVEIQVATFKGKCPE